MRNHREDIELALAGGRPERVPFTFYDGLFPEGFDPSYLQSKGMAICARRNVFTIVRPNVKVEEIREAGGVIRRVYTTPVGTLTAVSRTAVLAEAPVDHLVKTRDDYRIAEFIVKDTQYVPTYDSFLAERERIGDTGITIGQTCYCPLLDIQVVWVGQERFCYEVADNEDALLSLHAALVESHRELYEVVARSPAEHVLYGGNIVPTMIGPQRLREHVLPCWQAFAELLHEEGKQLGVHLDADNTLIMDMVAESPLDFIEAFTPPPDCPVSVAQARAAWPDKKLWVNFPSSVHLCREEVIQDAMRRIIEEAGDRKGFLFGVTEDVPLEHMNRSVNAALAVL